MNKYPPRDLGAKISNGSRKTFIDALNVIACFSVVALHQNGGIWQYEDSLNWKLSVIVETICYWAVPVFFMITGATLIGFDERYSTKRFFTRRFMRTVIPFLFFSLVAYFFSWVPKEGYVSGKEFLYGLFNTRFYHLYWFFIPLFWIYLYMPFFTKYRFLDKKLKQYVLLVVFILLTYSFWSELAGFYLSCSKNDLMGPFFYVILGYYLANYELCNNCKILVYVLGSLSFLLRGVLMLVLSSRDGDVNILLTNYYYPTTIFMAMSIFLIFKNTRYPERIGNVLNQLSALSLGIYLIHCFVISVEARVADFNINSFIYTIPLAFITYCLSALIVLVGKKMPLIKFVFP